VTEGTLVLYQIPLCKSSIMISLGAHVGRRLAPVGEAGLAVLLFDPQNVVHARRSSTKGAQSRGALSAVPLGVHADLQKRLTDGDIDSESG
jgi:hypothetical protein